MLNKLSSSPDVLSNASGGQLNVGIGSSIGAEVPSTVFDTNSRSITIIKKKQIKYKNQWNTHESGSNMNKTYFV